MNPLAVSQERIQGLVWLVSLIGCYVSAWRLFQYRTRITGTTEGDGFLRTGLVFAAVVLMLTASSIWYYQGADILGRLLHPALFVEKSK